MKGHTHLLFNLGFVSLLFIIFPVNSIFWIIGVLIVSPIFSRIPDRDQMISKITFNQIIPHRGKGTHNLLYGLPLIIMLFANNIPYYGEIIIFLIGSIFGSLFAHSFVDMFNYGGVWLGIFKIKGFLRWDSMLGNLFFQITGVMFFTISLLFYIDFL